MMKLLSITCLTLVGFLATVNCCNYGQNGRVYIVRMGHTNYFKIGGTTRTLPERMKELQNGNPMQLHRIYERVVPDCRRYEIRAQNAAATAAGTQRIILRSHTNGRNYRSEWFLVNNYNTFRTAVHIVLGK